MKCAIPGANCKILGRAIHALAKISEEMYVEPREESLSFRSVSPTNSAYCDFTFQDSYFTFYSFGNLEEEDALKCKISMKSALTVFKSLPVIEKLVKTCHIRLEPNSDQLIFIFEFKNSVVKTFFLPIIDCEQLTGPLIQDNLPNKLSAQARVLTDVLQNFQQNLPEITLEVMHQKLLMRNYVDETSTMANSTRTQLAVTIGEFDEYKIGQEAQITFCLKEFRAILSFAEALTLPLNVYFETMGKPVYFDLKQASFKANLVLSTLNPESNDVSTASTHEFKQSMRKKTTGKKTSRQPAKTSKRSSNKSNVLNESAISKTKETPLLNRTNSQNISRQTSFQNIDVPTSHVNNTRSNDINNRELSTNATSTHQTQENICKSLEISLQCRASTSKNCSPVVSSLGTAGSRITEPSIFSPSWKKQNDNREEENLDEMMEVDAIPASPPLPIVKVKKIFRKCYDATFDTRMLVGHDSILALDSDEES
ncbi:cell cycle checkpoint control protein RAD9A [Venturia canescens]|uniref:cell cycle checkpoint control protein RAD9A n=1 Tax=Venturia canescens TaxID=32260 RepID=UPI001C9D0294|nr:cell cycle checkpoint control protein RAD9A [Venturia canescens]